MKTETESVERKTGKRGFELLLPGERVKYLTCSADLAESYAACENRISAASYTKGDRVKIMDARILAALDVLERSVSSKKFDMENRTGIPMIASTKQKVQEFCKRKGISMVTFISLMSSELFDPLLDDQRL